MKKRKTEFRKFLYYCTMIMLAVGIIVTYSDIEREFKARRNQELIQKAKAIQPFINANGTIQDGIRAYFGTDGEWTVSDGVIHVSVERGYSPYHASTLTFDIPKNFTEYDNTEDKGLWIFENVWVNGEKQSVEQIRFWMSIIIGAAMEFETE